MNNFIIELGFFLNRIKKYIEINVKISGKRNEKRINFKIYRKFSNRNFLYQKSEQF